MVVGLGALGAVTRITLDVEPAYEMRQRVFEGLRVGRAARAPRRDHRAPATASACSPAGPEDVDQVWVKSRATERRRCATSCSARAPATVDRHPILGIDAVNCTPQLGRPGPLVGPPAALPHGLHAERRRGAAVGVPGAAPARGRRRSRPCARSRPDVRPLLQVSEIRTIAADRLWMSPQYGRDTRRLPLHLDAATGGRRRARSRASRARWRRSARGRTGASSSSPTRRDRAALRAAGRLRPAGRAPRPARRVPQRVAGALGPRGPRRRPARRAGSPTCRRTSRAARPRRSRRVRSIPLTMS